MFYEMFCCVIFLSSVCAAIILVIFFGCQLLLLDGIVSVSWNKLILYKMLHSVDFDNRVWLFVALEGIIFGNYWLFCNSIIPNSLSCLGLSLTHGVLSVGSWIFCGTINLKVSRERKLKEIVGLLLKDWWNGREKWER